MKMLCGSVLALAAVGSLNARADETTPAPAAKVTITSFEFPMARTRTAEVCGKVENAALPAFVRLEVDYDSDYQVPYNVPVGEDGIFCTVVVSLKARARGVLWHMPASMPVNPPPAVSEPVSPVPAPTRVY